MDDLNDVIDQNMSLAMIWRTRGKCLRSLSSLIQVRIIKNTLVISAHH